jgi:hypothetical protein
MMPSEFVVDDDVVVIVNADICTFKAVKGVVKAEVNPVRSAMVIG